MTKELVEDEKIQRVSELNSNARQSMLEIALRRDNECPGLYEVSCSSGSGVGTRTRTCENGQFSNYGACVINKCLDGFSLVQGKCISLTCSGSNQISCETKEGMGLLNRQCLNGDWKNTTNCMIKTCKGNNHLENGKCVPNTCEGEAISKCDIPNAISSKSRICNNGKWSSYGSCNISKCLEGHSLIAGSCIKYEVTAKIDPEVKLPPVLPDPNESDDDLDDVKNIAEFFEGCKDLNDLSTCNKRLRWFELSRPLDMAFLNLSESRGQDNEDCESWLNRNDVTFSITSTNIRHSDGARIQYEHTKKKYEKQFKKPFFAKSYSEFYKDSVVPGKCAYRVYDKDSLTSRCDYVSAKIDNRDNYFERGVTFYPVSSCVAVSNWPETKGQEFIRYNTMIKAIENEEVLVDLSDPIYINQFNLKSNYGPKGSSAKRWLEGQGISGEFYGAFVNEVAAYENENVTESRYINSFKRLFPDSFRFNNSVSQNNCAYEVRYTGANRNSCILSNCSKPNKAGYEWIRPVLKCEALSNHDDLSKNKLFRTYSTLIKLARSDKSQYQTITRAQLQDVNISIDSIGEVNQSAEDFYSKNGITANSFTTSRIYMAAAKEQEFGVIKNYEEKFNREFPESLMLKNNVFDQCPYYYQENGNSPVMCRYANCKKPKTLSTSPEVFRPAFLCRAPSNWDETKHKLFYIDVLNISQ